MKAEAIKTNMELSFRFFTDTWKFDMVKSAIEQYGPVLLFEKEGHEVELCYDIREKAFYFKLNKALAPGEDQSPVYIINALTNEG